MLVIDDSKSFILADKIKQCSDGSADVTNDGYSSYSSIGKDGTVAAHYAVVIDDKEKQARCCRYKVQNHQYTFFSLFEEKMSHFSTV